MFDIFPHGLLKPADADAINLILYQHPNWNIRENIINLLISATLPSKPYPNKYTI